MNVVPVGFILYIFIFRINGSFSLLVFMYIFNSLCDIVCSLANFHWPRAESRKIALFSVENLGFKWRERTVFGYHLFSIKNKNIKLEAYSQTCQNVNTRKAHF